jgi:NTE family protein
MKKEITLPPKPIEVALVLGAGGSRGSIIAGVLEVLETNNIPIDLIVGSSAGAIVGSMYAYYNNAKVVKDKILSLRFKDVVDISLLSYLLLPWSIHGISKGNNIEKMLSHQLPECNIEDLLIPLVVVTTDMETFETVDISKGPLIQAVLASGAAPPYFSPVVFNDKLLFDGGVSSPVPVKVAKKYNPRIIIAVNISQHCSRFSSKNMLSLSYKSLEIANYHLAKHECELADVVISPDLDIGGTDDSKSMILYESGRDATIAQIDKIKKLLNKS